MVEEHAVRHSFPVPGFNLIDHCQLSSLTDERDFIIPDTSEMLSTGDWWELIALETSTSRTPILPRKFQVSLAWTYSTGSELKLDTLCTQVVTDG
jgi:hypothetical protein